MSFRLTLWLLFCAVGMLVVQLFYLLHWEEIETISMLAEIGF